MAPRLFSCLRKIWHSSHHHPHDKNTISDTITEDDHKRAGPVVVELFSSQGCATSPVAELLVSRLGRGDYGAEFNVIVLNFHVDYWDYNGWKDPYGSSQWTVRQKTYVEALNLDTMFTPQIVVQGVNHCVGNDEDAMLAAIMSAPKFPNPTFQAKFENPTPGSLQVSLTGALRMKVENDGGNVMVALYENGLVTDCPSGDNKGRVLSNDFVVRRLEKLCTIKDISAKKTVSGTVNFSIWEGFNGTKCGIVVFFQNNARHIFGSQMMQLPDNI